MRKALVVTVVLAAAVLVAVAAALFQPWRLWTVRTAAEAAPALAAAPASSGTLRSLAHDTSGTAVLVTPAACT